MKRLIAILLLSTLTNNLIQPQVSYPATSNYSQPSTPDQRNLQDIHHQCDRILSENNPHVIRQLICETATRIKPTESATDDDMKRYELYAAILEEYTKVITTCFMQ